MIQMIRSILPVGQGAFYLEQFKLDSGKINVVYDCGSGTSVDLINRQIDDVFDSGEEIHAVFISHLDMDHINGIKHLLKHCHVRHIFFPLVTRKAIPLLLLNCFYKSGKADPESFVFRFIELSITSIVKPTTRQITILRRFCIRFCRIREKEGIVMMNIWNCTGARAKHSDQYDRVTSLISLLWVAITTSGRKNCSGGIFLSILSEKNVL